MCGMKKANKQDLAGMPQLTKDELMSLVCKYHCRGHTAKEIVKILSENHHLEINREKPYRLITRAAKAGRLRYVAPVDDNLVAQLRMQYGGLQEVQVVHSVVFADLAHQACESLLQLLRWYKQGPQQRKKVHIGFAGGPSMRILALRLADMLCQNQDGLPEELHLHALVSGFNPRDPTTDPNAFFTYFSRRPGMPVNVQFMGLHAPPLVRSDDFKKLRNMVGIKEVFDAKEDIDIFITSGAQWSDDHSLYRQCMEMSEGAVESLEASGCVGDIFWRPIGPDGPIGVTTPNRAMTLLELEEIPELIKKGKQVMLLFGSCGGCDRPKGKLLRTILDQKSVMATHLVADTRTVLQALGQ